MTIYSEFDPDEWITQSDAARIRRVTRQAIAALIQRKRLRTLRIAGYVLVNKVDVAEFSKLNPGRPAKRKGTR